MFSSECKNREPENKTKNKEFWPVQAAATILAGLILGALACAKIIPYVLFHTLVEIFTVVVAGVMLVVAVNTSEETSEAAHPFFLFLGIAYGAVAVLDLIHTLAYKGLNVFPGYGSNLATQLWVAARYTESLALLSSFRFLNRPFNPARALLPWTIYVAAVLAAVFAGVFPACYAEGTGLTRFKVASEYIIVLIMAACTWQLRAHRRHFPPETARLLFYTFFTTAAAEISFTLYTDVYGVANMVGHVFKLASFFLIYCALIKTNLREPHRLLYRQLSENLEKYRQTEAELKKARDFAEKVIDTARVLIVGLDREGRVIFLNKYAQEVTGCTEEAARGLDWFSHFLPLRYRKKVYEYFLSIWETGRCTSNYENPVLAAGGGERLVSWSCELWRDETGEAVMLLAAGTDITERAKIQKMLEELSYQDGLTQIANRRYFDLKLAEELAYARRYRLHLAVLICDIDLFKLYNDTYGHTSGDECLKSVAAALKGQLHRPGDVVARYGGEEFGVILPATGPSGAKIVAEKLRWAVFDLKIPHEKSPVGVVTVSVGVASIIPDGGISPDDLVGAADSALYRAKASGRNRVEVYREKINNGLIKPAAPQ